MVFAGEHPGEDLQRAITGAIVNHDDLLDGRAEQRANDGFDILALC